jgi:D-alanyl-D-alanine carboxypeptidase/D-alanyl-D-alanine-endopeptidase (penicillin-binding protein 4)
LSGRRAARERARLARRRRRIRRTIGVVLTTAVVVGAYASVEYLSEPSRPSLAEVRSAPAAGAADAVDDTCTPDPALHAPPVATPPAVAEALASPRLGANDTGASVWVDGIGEIVADDPDLPLIPASNEKLLTGMGALEILGPDATLTTVVRTTGPVLGTTLVGDLVLVGGGDPTLKAEGEHSLDDLARQVQAAGITEVNGRLLADESRYDNVRKAAGWTEQQYPSEAGPLSAIMVDRNRHTAETAFLDNPALVNTELFREALGRNGVAVSGPTEYGQASEGSLAVATLTSPTIKELVGIALLRSDNMISEMLVKEAGRHALGEGSTTGGLRAMTDALNRAYCVGLQGVADDGSGLSRVDVRSAREWRIMLQAARSQPWWPQFDGGLPVAGRSGTLSGRMRGTAAQEDVHAKTGTIRDAVSLSGVGTTESGRAFVFSVIVNGPSANGSESAIDAVVAAVAGITS